MPLFVAGNTCGFYFTESLIVPSSDCQLWGFEMALNGELTTLRRSQMTEWLVEIRIQMQVQIWSSLAKAEEQLHPFVVKFWQNLNSDLFVF